MNNKLMLMILDRLECQDEALCALLKFREEYTNAKRVEKFNQVMDRVEHFVENPGLYTVVRERECEELVFLDDSRLYQLAISIILKKLPRDRIIYICDRLCPDRDIASILQEWDAGCYDDDTHLLVGARPNSHQLDDCLVSLRSFGYKEEEIMAILNELTLTELANITPKIKIVRYKSVDRTNTI